MNLRYGYRSGSYANHASASAAYYCVSEPIFSVVYNIYDIWDLDKSYHSSYHRIKECL